MERIIKILIILVLIMKALIILLMKTLRELRSHNLRNVSSPDLCFSRIKDLPKKFLDFDVFLPSKCMNLQREKVWNLTQKRELIMSIFLERFIPCVCIMSLINGDMKDENGKWKEDILQVIDGKQRLTTLIDFLNNEFTIELEGQEYFFKDLPEDYQSAYLYKDVKGQLAYEDTKVRFTDQDKIDWFKRINFFGVPQDIEHINKLMK